MTTLHKLAATRIFEGLGPDTLTAVADAGQVIAAKAGERLIEEGQTNTHLLLVLGGAVEVRLLESQDRYSGVRLATCQSGDCIGEYAFVDGKPASASVIAVEPSELFKIHYSQLAHVLAKNDTLGRIFYRNLLVHLVKRLRAANAEFDLFRPM